MDRNTTVDLDAVEPVANRDSARWREMLSVALETHHATLVQLAAAQRQTQALREELRRYTAAAVVG